MQVVVAAPLSGGRARLVEALREVALPGIAVAGAEPVAPGAGSVAAIVWFEWGPVVLDVTSWAALDARANDLRAVAFGGGLLIQPPCEVLALEPMSAAAADGQPEDGQPEDGPSTDGEQAAGQQAGEQAGDQQAGAPRAGAQPGSGSADGAVAPPAAGDARLRRTSASSAQHLRETLIDLARERYGKERWSTADVLWTMDLLHLPSAVNAVVDEQVLIALGFPVSRVPLLDGRGGSPVAAAPVGPIAAPAPGTDPDATAYLAPVASPASAATDASVVTDASAATGVSAASDASGAAEAPPASDTGPAAAAAVPPAAPAGRPFLRAEQWDDPEVQQLPPRRIGVTAIAALVALLVIIGSIVVFMNLGGGDNNAQPGLSGGAPSSDPAAPPTSDPAQPAPAPSPTLAAPAGFVVRLADAQADCAAHSFGQTQQFFVSTPCVQVQRQLLTGTADGRPILVSLREVTMPTAAGASALLALVDTSGTGNVNDQLREGATFPGGPTALPTTDYASRAAGVRVRIVEGGFTDGGAANSAGLQAAVDALAAAL